MHIFKLNNDVLHAIILLLDPTSLICFAQTCHTACDISLPYLYSSVTLQGSGRLALIFCRSFLSGKAVYASSLRHLHVGSKTTRDICSQNASARNASLLADVLSQAHNLRSLKIFNLQPLVILEPRILESIIHRSREHLTTVNFHGLGDLCYTMISHMTGLRDITLSLCTKDVAEVLSPFCDSLEAVTFMFPNNLEKFFRSADRQWPHVHALTMPFQQSNQGLDVYRCFPNLRRLQLIERNRTRPDLTMDLQRVQWPTNAYFHYCRGSLFTLHVMHFSFHIKELDIWETIPTDQQELEVDALLGVVMRAKPLSLSLKFNPTRYTFAGIPPPAAVLGGLVPLLPNLKFLQIYILYTTKTFLRLVC